MHSVPNFIRERPAAVRRALARIEPFTFERVYGGFWGRIVRTGGTDAIRRSAERCRRFAPDDGP